MPGFALFIKCPAQMKINEGIPTKSDTDKPKRVTCIQTSFRYRIRGVSRSIFAIIQALTRIVLTRIEKHVSDKFIILVKHDYAKISPDLIFHRFLIFNFLLFGTIVSSV